MSEGKVTIKKGKMLALEIEEGAVSQEMQESSRNWEGQGDVKKADSIRDPDDSHITYMVKAESAQGSEKNRGRGKLPE